MKRIFSLSPTSSSQVSSREIDGFRIAFVATNTDVRRFHPYKFTPCYIRFPAMENNVSTEPKPRLTPEEYLAIERKADRRSEFPDGHMFAMSRATREHTKIAVNIARELSTELFDRAW